MLPRENRLKKEKEFEAVFKGGRTFKGEYVLLRYLVNGTDKTKVGFVVSKKVSKLATQRNKIKRRMREITRKRKESIKDGLSIIMVALPRSIGAGYAEMEKDIGNLLDKEGLAKKQ